MLDPKNHHHGPEPRSKIPCPQLRKPQGKAKMELKMVRGGNVLKKMPSALMLPLLQVYVL